AIVEWGACERQRTVTAKVGELVARAQAARVESPAIFVVGPVVGRRDLIKWLEERPVSQSEDRDAAGQDAGQPAPTAS
ncbi:MAG: hypothetical protein M1457_09740, partial [bacterium]|nr:hypothetical protein [bacterium]